LELVYLWVKNYKNIHEQGFNFSSRFSCDYNEKTNELTIEENDDYIPDFFGKNINVTAIVGKNGSGKSSVLEYLSDSPKFVVTFENDEFQVNEDIEVINKTKYEYTNKVVNLDYIYIPTSDYLINNLTKFGDKELNDKNSLNFIFEGDNLSGEHKLSAYYKLIYNQFELFLKGKNTTHIVFPKNIMMRMEYMVELSLDQYLGEKNPLSDQIYNLVLENIFYDDNELYDDNKIDILFKKYIQENNKNLSNKGLFNYLQENITDNSLLQIFDKREKFCKLFKDFNTASYYSYQFKNYFDGYKIPLEQFPVEAFIMQIDLEEHKDAKEHFYINYEWDTKLSSGEFNMINLFSVIFYELNKNPNLVYLLIDEGESFLHPNWQKKYISYIVQFIKDNFPNRKIHLILTSHSPFLLSDIPKQNIIFLDKDEDENCQVLKHNEVLEKKQTFGQNIHTLLSDSFFMEDGLIGEFSKRKINEIKKLYQLTQNKNVQKRLEKVRIKELAQKAFNRRKKRLWQIQKIIGEPFLQRVIKNYLDELELLFSDDETLIAKELAEIEERKKELEALQKRKG